MNSMLVKGFKQYYKGPTLKEKKKMPKRVSLN